MACNQYFVEVGKRAPSRRKRAYFTAEFKSIYGDRKGIATLISPHIPPQQSTGNAPFLKGGTQTYASDAAAVSADDPKPKEWLSGLVAGWRLSSPGRSRNYPQSTVRQRPVVGKYATSPR